MREIDDDCIRILETLCQYPDGLSRNESWQMVGGMGKGAYQWRLELLEKVSLIRRTQTGKQTKIVTPSEGAKVITDVKEIIATLDDAHKKITNILEPFARQLGLSKDNKSKILPESKDDINFYFIL
jgi:hypothetical protein